MQNLKTIGIVILIVGIVILAVSLLADPIGIGEGDKFGTRQVIGTIAGAVATITGAVLVLRERRLG